MGVRTTAGTTIGISASNPSTYDAAGYKALTYTLIGEITNAGEFGREYAVVTHNPIDTRGTVKKKGSFNEGQMQLQLGLDTDDGGQIILKQAVDSDDDYSFHVRLQSGDDYYFSAQAVSFKIGAGSVDQITSATCTLEISTSDSGVGIVEDLT